MSATINPALLEALRYDDDIEFRRALEEERHWQWPQSSPSSDYELLMKAIKLGRKRITNLLLDKGAEVYKNGSQTTPLHQAVTLVGWNEIVQKLLILGAKVAVQNTRGDTALHQAFNCRAPHPVMEMLLKAYTKETKMDKTNRDGLSFLHIVSTRDNSKYLQEYLDAYETDVDAQVSLSSKSYPGYTALHFAVAYGRYENVKILLENGADIYFTDVKGSTPLHFALERRSCCMIDLLLSYDKSNSNIVNNQGLSHFMAACAGSNEYTVEQFLNIAEITRPSSSLNLINSRVRDDPSYQLSGYTPLHFAAEFGQLVTLHGLIGIGADACALTSSNLTPFVLAYQRQQINVCYLMHQICEYAVDKTLFACADVNDAVTQITGCESIASTADDHSPHIIKQEAQSAEQIYDELPLVPSPGPYTLDFADFYNLFNM